MLQRSLRRWDMRGAGALFALKLTWASWRVAVVGDYPCAYKR